MKAADIMSNRVLSVLPDAPITTAIRIMLFNRISGLPVVDQSGQLVGIVSEGDFLRRGETGTERRRPDWLEFLLGPGRLADEYVRAHARKVADVMTTKVVTVGPETEAREIVDLMERNHIKRVPVVQNNHVVGIVTRRSLLQGLAAFTARPKSTLTDDAALRAAVLAEIQKLPWTPRASLNVIVRDGVVHLWGVILDERQRRAMCLAAEGVNGVKAVHDHLAWVEPVTGMSFESPEDLAAQKSAMAG
jgi:CBS-domain-containing membrane protein